MDNIDIGYWYYLIEPQWYLDCWDHHCCPNHCSFATINTSQFKFQSKIRAIPNSNKLRTHTNNKENSKNTNNSKKINCKQRQMQRNIQSLVHNCQNFNKATLSNNCKSLPPTLQNLLTFNLTRISISRSALRQPTAPSSTQWIGKVSKITRRWCRSG